MQQFQAEDQTEMLGETQLSNWSKSGRSPCYVWKAKDVTGIHEALDQARARHLSVIARGAGHSYTDAAWNTGDMILDLTPMRRIVSWDPRQGVIKVEPGVTLRDMLLVTLPEGWWPFATPSTPDVTIGGCTAMNVNGKNAWQCGTFGEHVLAIDVLLASGETLTLMPERDGGLFHAFIGSLGLLGILTSVTIQLQSLPSDRVMVAKHSASTLSEVLYCFAIQLPQSDFIEAWLDGFAVGKHLGRGQVTSATIASDSGPYQRSGVLTPGLVDQLETGLVRRAGGIFRPAFLPSMPLANRARYWWGRCRNQRGSQPQTGLLPYTYYPPAAFAGYHKVLPKGVETFQAFVPGSKAGEVFERVLSYSQQQGCIPIWCIIKQHRHDPFLLSYQVDGFSLELNYPRTRQTHRTLERMLRHNIDMVIEAGGRFYLAKDHFMTAAQYRRSVGDAVVDRFLKLKQQYDPDHLFQSDLFRRLFQCADRSGAR